MVDGVAFLLEGGEGEKPGSTDGVLELPKKEFSRDTDPEGPGCQSERVMVLNTVSDGGGYGGWVLGVRIVDFISTKSESGG